ncbi:hypothetical protein BD779DRAFT_1791763 [Infundibulicybe gibba]|nr:hypothetical protein BD779DRAFT_1791763 [Infundibulicybe gibba]
MSIQEATKDITANEKGQDLALLYHGRCLWESGNRAYQAGPWEADNNLQLASIGDGRSQHSKDVQMREQDSFFHSPPRDFLESEGSIDILSQEGFDRTKEIVGDIISSVEALKLHNISERERKHLPLHQSIEAAELVGRTKKDCTIEPEGVNANNRSLNFPASPTLPYTRATVPRRRMTNAINFMVYFTRSWVLAEGERKFALTIYFALGLVKTPSQKGADFPVVSWRWSDIVCIYLLVVGQSFRFNDLLIYVDKLVGRAGKDGLNGIITAVVGVWVDIGSGVGLSCY